MLLARELQSAGYDGDPASFVALLIGAFSKCPPRWTVDELTINPDKAMRFCAHVRRESGCPRLGDEVILGTLVNRRKRGELAGKPRRTVSFAIRTEEELWRCGFRQSRVEFYDIIADAMHCHCPNWNDQELLCRPQEAIKICDHVRKFTRMSNLADNVILRILVNGRKGGWRRRHA